METVFFKRFERQAHGEGLKAHATHYCAGCGHGLVHKYLAEAIDALGIQERTVAVSPVGCSVFLYSYLDVGNTQAAHGRAPAVALGHKLANPESIVVSYQGDGDLASIGLAEIVQVAQMGIPITILFINNAIYGMTGGQMAPTTLREQTTTTSPLGRTALMGQPLKVAELMAQLDGPIYVERVALFNNKQRFHARKAIQKALQLQVEGRGFAFIEVLSECPTHLHLTPEESQRWVEEEMVPVFPLGIKKDVSPDPWFHMDKPVFDPAAILGLIDAQSEKIERFATGFPSHLDPQDVSLKFAGTGGDGAQMIAKLTCQTAINEGFDSTYIPSYGPESRGGTSYADVHIARREVLSPAAPDPHILVAFNSPSLFKFGPSVRPGGTIIYDSTVINSCPSLDPTIRVLALPLTQIAADLGNTKVKNIVALGVLQEATHLLPERSYLAAMKQVLHGNETLWTLDNIAYRKGTLATSEEEVSTHTLHQVQHTNGHSARSTS